MERDERLTQPRPILSTEMIGREPFLTDSGRVGNADMDANMGGAPDTDPTSASASPNTGVVLVFALDVFFPALIQPIFHHRA